MKVLSAYFDLETYSAHSPANRTTAWQECFELLDVSYTWIALSLTPSLPQVLPEWPYCQQAQCKHWFTDIQTSSHPQICLDYRACNRPQLYTFCHCASFKISRSRNKFVESPKKQTKHTQILSWMRFVCFFGILSTFCSFFGRSYGCTILFRD